MIARMRIVRQREVLHALADAVEAAGGEFGDRVIGPRGERPAQAHRSRSIIRRGMNDP